MRAVILFILACLWGVASAEVYTWRDASGKIHYSDTPPPGVDAKKMRAGAPSTSNSLMAIPRTLTLPSGLIVSEELEKRTIA